MHPTTAACSTGGINPDVAYSTPTEYNILMNRFKLLNLVQRAARTDVMEMIDTVGLEALACKGTWGMRRTETASLRKRDEIYGDQSFSQVRMSSRARRHSMGSPTSLQRDARGSRGEFSGRVQRVTRHRSESQRKQIFERLAEPRRRRLPFVESVSVAEENGVMQGKAVARPLSSPQRSCRATQTNGFTDGGHSNIAYAFRGKNGSPRDAPLPLSGQRDGTAMQSVRTLPPSPSHTEACSHVCSVLSDNATSAQLVNVGPHGERAASPSSGPKSADGGLPLPPLPRTESGASENAYAPHGEACSESIPGVANWVHSPTVGKSLTLCPSLSHSHGSRSVSTPKRVAGNLKPKVKPIMAGDSSTVPMDIIRHAAALITGQQVPKSSSMHNVERAQDVPLSGNPSIGVPSRSARLSIPPTSPINKSYVLTGHDSQTGSASSAGIGSFPLKPVGGLDDMRSHLPENMERDTLRELAKVIDDMLHDHQSILNEVVKETDTNDSDDASKVDVGATDAPPATLDYAATLCEQGLLTNTEEVDGMLIYARLQRRVEQMDDDLASIQMRNDSRISNSETVEEAGKEGVMVTPSSVAATPGVAPPRRARRLRGQIPDAIVRRLIAHRKEAFEYIAYNERLWNTSQISQFVFAQRLTNALLDDCLSEVVAEVSTIMDDYVEGLADHELQ